jgi:hypothetical protein
LFNVHNQTAFAADAVHLPDKNGLMIVAAVIKVTCSFLNDGTTRLSEKQMPLFYGDEYFGETGKSSVRYANDMVYEKSGTDIAVNGTAYAPKGNPVTRIPVSVSVGNHKKTIVVWGDRQWKSTLGFVSKTQPVPFVTMPIRYERAFGGEDTSHKNKEKHGTCKENPVGMGYRLSSGKKSITGLSIPNIENPLHLIKNWNDKPKPEGFGFVAPLWEPRLSQGGTHNAEWQKERISLPPLDYDNRFNNAAAPDLITKKALKGTETVTLKNLHPVYETFRFKLPGYVFRVAYIFEHQTVKPKPVLDTLIIEPDEKRFMMVYRCHYPGPLPWSQLKQVTIHEENTNASV